MRSVMLELLVGFAPGSVAKRTGRLGCQASLRTGEGAWCGRATTGEGSIS